MDALEALGTRASAVRLVEPAPSEALLTAALRAAVRAPDHGMLRPWRFLLVRGAARDRLGEVLAESLARREPGAAPETLEKEAKKPLRAPLIVVVVAKVQPDHPKIPEVEQVVSAGSAAQNLMLAFHAEGFGCMWRTGSPAYDPAVKRAFGIEAHDHIIGLIYVGTPVALTLERNRPDHTQFVEDWTEPATAG
jgi:nitroreductase